MTTDPLVKIGCALGQLRKDVTERLDKLESHLLTAHERIQQFEADSIDGPAIDLVVIRTELTSQAERIARLEIQVTQLLADLARLRNG